MSWAGPEPAPVWLDLAREYTERWHHQQHIRDAVNKPGLKDPHWMAPVLAAFVWAMPHAYRDLSARPARALAVSNSTAHTPFLPRSTQCPLNKTRLGAAAAQNSTSKDSPPAQCPGTGTRPT